MQKFYLLRRASFLWVLFVFMLIFIGLMTPATLQAGPGYGLTPTPTSTSLPPTDTPPPPTPTETPRPPEDEPDEVEFQFGCDLTCPLDPALTAGEIHVRLVHEGSGWISEGTISMGQKASFQVPYPDRWQVFLINENEPPVLLGTVQANGGAQLLDCPAQCPAPPPPPPVLPETGNKDQAVSLDIVIVVTAGLLLIVGGLIIFSVKNVFTPDRG